MLESHIHNTLDAVTVELAMLGYKTIAHKRVSFLQYHHSTYGYQGLSLVDSDQQYLNHQHSIIKWAFHTFTTDLKNDIAKNYLTKNNFYQVTNQNIDDDLYNEYLAITALYHLPCVVDCLDYFFITKPYKKKMCIAYNHNNYTLQQLTLQQFKPITLSYLRYPYYPLGTLKKFLSNQQKIHDTLTYTAKLIMMCTQIVDAIQQIHNAGWIHGDIKPSNIMVKYRHDSNKIYNDQSKKILQTVLIDFSLATRIDYQVSHKRVENSTEKVVNGTPAYLAPECWQGSKKSVYSDYYALGITLYELLTGTKPFLMQENNQYTTQQPKKLPPRTVHSWQNYHNNLIINQNYFIQKVQENLVNERMKTHRSNNRTKLLPSMTLDNKTLQFIDKIYYLIESLLLKSPQKRQLKTL